MSAPSARAWPRRRRKAYAAIDQIDWPDGFCRRDIGRRAIERGADGSEHAARSREHPHADLADLFPGFESHWIDTSVGKMFARSGGDGPPLLLLHGYAQTNVMWHKVAPALAQHFTLVICPTCPAMAGRTRRNPAPATRPTTSARWRM